VPPHDASLPSAKGWSIALTCVRHRCAAGEAIGVLRVIAQASHESSIVIRLAF
jgi:hypothetical protein